MLTGLRNAVGGPNLTCVVNVADDETIYGLDVSPDLDTVTYTLAGAIDPDRGWGLRSETWQAIESLRAYGTANGDPELGWFSLGDQDLGTHLYRTTRLAAGVPLINGLNVARRSIGNQILVDAVSGSIDLVKEGKALGASLSECRTLFPGSVLEMVAVAEESGKLDTELIRIANVTEADLDRQLKTAVALAEPLMLFLIAGFIGTIFIGMVIPIFTLQDYIK